MNIHVIYDEILREKVPLVTVFDAALKKEADQMLETMKKSNGIGLAANQVGLRKQLIVLGYERHDDKDKNPAIPFQALCNPRVVKFSKEKDTMTEGCLSLPGLELPVERPSGVTITAQTLDGKQTTIKAKGLYARVLQHEIDHLNGVLFTDRVANYHNLEDYRWAKIVFCGSDDFSAQALSQLNEAGLNVISVITETDKRSGRGAQTAESVIKQQAQANGIAVFQPETKDDITAVLTQLRPDLLVLASYGKILPAEALAAPIYGCLNIHPSLLPKYRGATPIQSAILNGDTETGVTIMEMVPAVDAGRIIAQQRVDLTGTETTTSLKADLANRGARLLVETIPIYLAGQATPQDQLGEPTLTRKLTKEMGELNWAEPIEVIDRQIRALNPWPGTFTWLGDKRLKILSAHRSGQELQLETVQLEGKNPAAWADFQRGYADSLTKTDWYGKIS